jgi:hypothetical protein
VRGRIEETVGEGKADPRKRMKSDDNIRGGGAYSEKDPAQPLESNIGSETERNG